MKNTIFRITFSILIYLFPSLILGGEVIEISTKDGKTFYYEILSTSNQTLKVISGDNKYSGKIETPEEVVYDDLTYKVTTIGKSAFSSCDKLESIIIPKSIISIEDYSFKACKSLSYIEFKDGQNTLNLGHGATDGSEVGLFVDCPVKEVYIGRPIQYSSAYEKYTAFRNNKTLEKATFGEYVQETLWSTFLGCSALTSVDLGQVQTISKSTFSDCTSLPQIPDISKVKTIGDYAFNGCTSITEAIIPKNVTTIGNFAFMGCESISKVNLEDGQNTLNLGHGATSGSQVGLFIDCAVKEAYIGRPIQYSSSYGKYTAFRDNKTLEKATFGEYVKETLWCAFCGCSALTSVDLGQVQTISKSTFFGCTSLSQFPDISKVKTIGDYAFNGCTSLEEIIIPESVTDIGDYSFSQCENVSKVVFEDSQNILNLGKGSNDNSNVGLFIDCPVKDVYIGRPIKYYFMSGGYTAFYKNKYVENVEYGNNVEEVNYNEFYECKNLTTLKLSESIIKLNDYCFYGCGITELVLPSSIQKINQFSFASSPLSKISSLSIVPPVLTKSAFDEQTYNTATLSVPEVSISDYESTEPWKDFFNIEIYNGIDDIFMDCINIHDGNNIIFSINGKRIYEDIDNLKSGIYIINGKKIYIK